MKHSTRNRPAPNRATRSHSARGFTIIELLIAITIFGLLIVGVLSSLARENSAFNDSTRRLVALRNANYAFSRLEQDIRTAGINLPAGQPELVYMDADVVAFTADNVTNLRNDPFAVYVDVDAPNGQVRLPTTAVTVPNSGGYQFPDTVYSEIPGVASQAELIMFYFEADATTPRTDDYVLWRKVNGTAPERVARNILQRTGEPFFTMYERPSAGGLVQLPDSITLFYDRALADTIQRIEGVRAIEVNMRATNGLSGDLEDIVEGSRFIELPNVGFNDLLVCGDEPILGTGVTATATTLPSGDPAIQVTWNPATDETAGEKDVVLYLLWRRIDGTTDWGDPLVTIPAGASSYVYDDTGATQGETYEYALAAQDCTPSLSPLTTSSSATMPVS